MNNNHNLTETDLNNIIVRFALEEQIQKQAMKEPSWRLDNINSMTLYFYITGERNALSYVKIPLRISAIESIQNVDSFCFLWSISAQLRPISNSKNGHVTKVSIYGQSSDELNIEGFDFSDGFRSSDVNKFGKLNNLSGKIFVFFYTTRKHKLIPIKVSKDVSDRAIDLLNYKNHYVSIKNLNVFLGKQDCRKICRRCLI